jgi:hypothetical protein
MRCTVGANTFNKRDMIKTKKRSAHFLERADLPVRGNGGFKLLRHGIEREHFPAATQKSTGDVVGQREYFPGRVSKRSCDTVGNRENFPAVKFRFVDIVLLFIGKGWSDIKVRSA